MNKGTKSQEATKFNGACEPLPWVSPEPQNLNERQIGKRKREKEEIFFLFIILFLLVYFLALYPQGY